MSDNSPLISVILCAYNGSNFIEEQINSILDQTYPNYEIVIVDDCSTDQTSEILSKYATAHNQIKYHQNIENIGFNLNFNKAIGLAKGEYIAISDQDDIWINNKLERLFINIKDKGIIFSNSRLMDEKGEKLPNYLIPKFNESFYNSYKKLLLYNIVTGHTVLFHKRMILQFLPIPQNGYYDWWMGIIGHYHDELIYLDEVLTYYRIHSNSVMQLSKQQHIKKELIQFNSMLTQASIFLSYKYLRSEDKSYVKEFIATHEAKRDSPLSLKYISFLYRHFFELYPERMKKSKLSNLNFFLKKTYQKH